MGNQRHSGFNGVKLMAVTIKEENETEVLLKIDNGDFKKMREVLQRWNFKDEQAFLRFVVSALLETEDTKIGIFDKGILIPIIPAKHSLKD